MPITNLPAVRAFIRIWYPRANDACYYHQFDRSVDAGEWSDAAFDRMLDNDRETVAAEVAARFGMTRDQLIADFTAYCMEQEERAAHAYFAASRKEKYDASQRA